MGFVGELLSSNGLKLLFAMYSVEPVSCRMSLLLLMAIKMVVSSHLLEGSMSVRHHSVCDDILVENICFFCFVLIAIKLQKEVRDRMGQQTSLCESIILLLDKWSLA